MAFNEAILANSRPNLFELVAQDSMHEALRPAFEYVCKVSARMNPSVFGTVWRLRDEIYLIFEGAIQLLFLKSYDASFSEYFYYLKRVRCGVHKKEKLDSRLRLFSVFCLAFVPYLKVKLERLYSRLTSENDAVQIRWCRGQGAKLLMKYLIFKLIPYFQFLWTVCAFVFGLRYLISGAQFYSPLLWIAGVTIIRQMDEETVSDTKSRWWTVFSHFFSLALFLLKFLEWWYSEDNEAALRKMALLPIPPPPSLQPCCDGMALPSNPQLCPLCLKDREEPTALTTSGYVFCHGCITDYLTHFGKCPVTFIPTSNQQLVRLFTEPQY